MLKKLWLDEGGAILSFELMLIMVILVIGISIGMVVLRDAVISEFQCIALAVNSLNPGYAYADLLYAGNLGAEAMVNGTDASITTLGIDVANGVILGDIAAGGIVTPAPDTYPSVTTIVSP
jgi:hypothetical protein